MAVYTQLGITDVTNFLNRYECGTLTSYEGITAGVENTNYFLYTCQNTFVLTLFEKRVDENDLPYFLNLMNHMNVQGIKCPQVLFDTHGNAFGTIKGKKAIIISFLKGKSVEGNITAESCRKMGVLLGNMHRATENFTMHRENTLGLNGWQNLIADIGNHMPTEYQHLVQTEIAFQRKNPNTHLPSGAIHADLFVDNVFFEKQNISGVIDFYFGCTDAYVYDLAITLTAWCFEQFDHINIPRAMAMVQGYQTVRPLTDAEKTYLPIALRGASLRFMLTRLYDKINTPENAVVVVKDPSEYAKKLAFYQGHDITQNGIFD